MKNFLLLVGILTACNQTPEQFIFHQIAAPATTPPAIPEESTSNGFNVVEKNDLFEFHYSWSIEAALIPQLVKRLYMNMEEDRAELIALTEKAKSDPVAYYNSFTEYTTSGQSTRLLSLRIDNNIYTDGARGDYNINALLWDRKTATGVEAADLFAKTSDMSQLLTQRWCAGLAGDRDMGGCPVLDAVTIIPTDKNGNGRFETLVLILVTPTPAYARASYVRSEVELTITPDLIAALKPDYRDSFEVDQP